jgi:dipeptidyl aminopeptidase/acylaminoacyl peptidase
VTGTDREWDRCGDNQTYSSQVQAVCDWFGPTDLLRMNDVPGALDHDAEDSPESALIGGPIQENQERARRANPIAYVSASAAPFLIMHGEQDDIVPPSQSELLHGALRQAGVESTLVLVKGAGHGLWKADGGSEVLLQRVLAFFIRHLRS